MKPPEVRKYSCSAIAWSYGVAAPCVTRRASVRTSCGSDDGSREYLTDQPDVSLWTTTASYKASRFGMDWINALLRRHGDGHWCLTVDPDEFLVYPHANTRPLRALTDWLASSGTRSFSAMLLDMYPKGPVTAQPYAEGQDPFEIASWFDPANYAIRKNGLYRNLWIQGGPRARTLFAEDPDGLSWKTRHLRDWAAGRPFAWVDDMITPRDRAWIAAHHPAPALLLRIHPRHGLRDRDFTALTRWAEGLSPAGR